MNTLTKICVLVVCVVAMLLVDLAFAPEADAVFGTRRRTALVTAAVVSSADSAKVSQSQQEAAAAQQQAAAAEQEAAQAKAAAEASKQQPAASAPAPGALPLGSIVTELPKGCTKFSNKGVEYQRCGPDYYRAAFQGSQLVYVTTQP